MSREEFSIIDNVIKLFDNCVYSLEKLTNRYQEISKLYEKNKITRMILEIWKVKITFIFL